MTNINEIPDLMFPIVGYRLWTYSPPHVLSLYGDETKWHNGKLESAHCLGDETIECLTAPCKGKGCGFYAYKSIDDLHMKNADLIYCELKELVYGEVFLSGRIKEHEYGWRATKAKIKGFYDTEIGKKAAELINVPLLPCPKEIESYEQDRKGNQGMESGRNATWLSPGVTYTITAHYAPAPARGADTGPPAKQQIDDLWWHVPAGWGAK